MRKLILVILALASVLLPIASADVHVYRCNPGGWGCSQVASIPAIVDCYLYLPQPGQNQISDCDGIPPL